MKYRIIFLKRIEKDVSGIQTQIAQRILDKIKWLSENFDQITPQLLSSNLKGYFKIRVGDYRVIYKVNYEERIITIHMIGHRKDIYKYF